MAVKDSTIRVPDMEHIDSQIDWNDVRLFLLVVQCGSLRAASLKIQKSVNSVRRRIQCLENRLKCQLLLRDAFGCHLTQQGHRFLRASQPMIGASRHLSKGFPRRSSDVDHTVAVWADEGLDIFWLLPKLAEFQRSHPSLQINLNGARHPPDIYTFQADLSIQLEIPKRRELMVSKLGHLHMQLYASHEFISRYGIPTKIQDLQNSRLVVEEMPDDQWSEWAQMLKKLPGQSVAAKTNSRSAHAFAISSGVGIGLLPTYPTMASNHLVPVLPQLRFKRDMFITYRRDVAEIQQVRAVITWLKKVTCPKSHPWFAE